MNEINFDDIEGRLGDDVQIAFTVHDRDGNTVSVAGAAATFRVGAIGNTSQLVEKTESDGITLAGVVATVALNLGELESAGKYWGQLRITKAGKVMVAAEGEINVLPLIGDE